MIGNIARRWREWRARERSELDAIGVDEAGRIARELGMSTGELRDLARRGTDSADLLLKRMRAMGLDPKEFNLRETAVFRDLQRLCTMCKSKGECAMHLAKEEGDPDWVGWQDICPNDAVLKMYSTLERCGPAANPDAASGRDFAAR